MAFKTIDSTTDSETAAVRSNIALLVAAGVVLGMAIAGFFDGIVIHQILQWHHMVTTIRPATDLTNLEINTFWDGVFHMGTSVLAVIGLTLLWRALRQESAPRSAQPLIGAGLIGAGSFNLIEGLIDHHLLAIHHVKPGVNQVAWDVGFLVVSAVLVVSGWVVLANFLTNHQPGE
ncbi:DUF2243 domain-containing protein [Oscillatoria sp. FACHB-1407]|uniref:DUF2243 domain-containing protein n=1 Tax=Oscillatoria sp. FACHB-1407 TaxID=2692847 RepID=UPI001685A5C1|nr:DUF2243 domain-containing protein [Oscillatoria sp. FACHB-1407]MBD2460306.1 DUF2243 domain-containing protein [Oscillatoria sp. FACHB-1407]